MGWSRGAIDAYLARGGDIKAVDKFLLRGGKITQPKAKVNSTKDSIGYGASYHFGQRFSQYVEDGEDHRLTKSCGGVLHDDYSEESFP